MYLKEEFDRNGNLTKTDFYPSADQLRYAAARSSLKNEQKSDKELLKELSIPQNSLNKWETEYGNHFREWLYWYIENTRGPIRDALFAFGLDQAFRGNYNFWKDVARTAGAISSEKVELKATITKGVDELANLSDGAIEAEFNNLVAELTGTKGSNEEEAPALEGDSGGERERDKVGVSALQEGSEALHF